MEERAPRDEVASAVGATLLPLAQACLFVWLGSAGVPALLLIVVLPPLVAALSYVVSGRRSAVACLVFSLMLDFPALLLITVTQTF